MLTPFPSSIKFQDTGYFSKMMNDYLDRNEELSRFYNNFPDLDGFQRQIEEKGNNYPDANRKVLSESLSTQNEVVELSELSIENIGLLKNNNTFTITTGHQLNLFTGPLYFLYKITSVINLSKLLKSKYPAFDFVPVYWMASEDHDFDEICYFNFKGNRLKWNRDSGGAVGRMSTEGLDEVLELFEKELGSGKNATRLKELFRKSYLNHKDLSTATRYLANELFGDQGLVIVDGDDRHLKSLFAPNVQEELLNQSCHSSVVKSSELLEKKYHAQVNPREINLFYLGDQLRERIVFEDGCYKVVQTDMEFTRDEILDELKNFPERFSPNALMRPLYQEVILPNLCYTGGGGEIAYWMQLKDYFEAVNVTFPILLLRNSALLISEKEVKKLAKLEISAADLFLKENELINKKVKEISDIEIDFSDEKEKIQGMFDSMKQVASKTDKSFIGAVLAQEKKQLNGLEKLEKRLLRAQKRKYSERVERVTGIKEDLFPKQSLQERQANFSEFYETHGNDLISILLQRLDPLKLEFDLIQI